MYFNLLWGSGYAVIGAIIGFFVARRSKKGK